MRGPEPPPAMLRARGPIGKPRGRLNHWRGVPLVVTNTRPNNGPSEYCDNPPTRPSTGTIFAWPRRAWTTQPPECLNRAQRPYRPRISLP